MLKKLEGFLLNKFGGKLIARGAVIAAGAVASLLAGPQAQALIAKAAPALALIGISFSGPVDEIALASAFIGGANWLFEWFKARRMANPASPAVQTDDSKPGATIPALPAK